MVRFVRQDLPLMNACWLGLALVGDTQYDLFHSLPWYGGQAQGLVGSPVSPFSLLVDGCHIG